MLYLHSFSKSNFKHPDAKNHQHQLVQEEVGSKEIKRIRYSKGGMYYDSESN